MRKRIAQTAALVALALGLAGSPAWAQGSGTFKYAEQVKLITMDPQQQSGSGVPYLRPVYESLFEKGPDGEALPLLATGYEVDALDVTITLREGVSFSNGEAFNAEAAAANINRGVRLGIIEGLQTVESAEAVDEFTLRIRLKEIDPAIINSLCYTGGMMIAPAAMEDPALDRNPVGTGPYVHSRELSREGEVQVYVPNPTYWDKDKIGLSRYEVWEIPDDTARLNALKTGQIDAGNWLSNAQAAIIDRSPDLRLIRHKGGGLNYHVVISDREGTVVPAFADPLVRKAMAHAIDREAFNQAIQFGLAVKSFQPYGQGDWAYDPALDGVYEYDLDKARELMAQSNFPDGFAFDMPSIPIYQSRLEALAGFFQEIGITMNIVPVEPGTLARRSRTTDFPATNLVWNTITDPKFVALRYIYENAAYNPFKAKPSEELLALAREGLTSVETEVRAPIYRKMAAQLAEEAFLIFVTNAPILFGVSEKTANNPTVVYRYGEDSINLRGLRAND